MGRRRNETELQWMNRLRAVRGLEPLGVPADKLMETTRAAVCFVNAGSGHGGERAKLNAFLALFHPEIEPHSPRWRELMQSAEDRR